MGELYTAGFRVERLDSAFSTNPVTGELNWIIVAVSGPRAPVGER